MYVKPDDRIEVKNDANRCLEIVEGLQDARVQYEQTRSAAQWTGMKSRVGQAQRRPKLCKIALYLTGILSELRCSLRRSSSSPSPGQRPGEGATTEPLRPNGPTVLLGMKENRWSVGPKNHIRYPPFPRALPWAGRTFAPLERKKNRINRFHENIHFFAQVSAAPPIS
ncbi:MAG: hypothetical protein IT426_21445 [Pirellulales bacterium]|nr:hypothetical protein [Pirellulales bacterium]